MNNKEDKRETFAPEKVPLLGSLGILALGDIGFEAWRDVKKKNNRKDINEEE